MIHKDNAVSELIGALLLIGVLAGVFAVVTVMLISQPPPVQAPAVEFDLFYEYQPDNPDGFLVIAHQRGDSFRVFDSPSDTTDDQSEFYVNVNGIRYSIVRNSPGEHELELVKSSSSNADTFTVGDQLRTSMNNPANLPSVQFIERNPDGSEYLLWGKNPTVDNRYCSITPSFNAINPLTNDSITTEPIRGPAPLHLKFRDTSIIIGCSDITRRWIRIQGGSENAFSINKIETDNQTFYESGQVYLEICSGSAGCMSSLPREIEITSPPCTTPDPVHAQYSTDKPTTTHEKVLDIQFFDESTGNIKYWNWDFGNSQSLITESSQDPIVHFTEGIYSVVLEVGNECSYSRTDPVQVSVGQTDPPCEVFPTIIASSTSGSAPFTVLLTDSSTTEGGEILSRVWEFGDGSINSTETSIPHTYDEPGIYQVNLTVTNSCGKSSTTFETISVDCPSITADFTTNSSQGSAPLSLAFNGTASSDANITRYEWYFGDNTTNSTHQSPVHTFSVPDDYQVVLTVFNECGQHDSVMHPIRVTCPPVTAGFTTNTSSGVTPLTVAFTDTSTSAKPITQWQWNFGDGTTDATNQNPTHTFTNPGTYQVTLTATNNCGQFNTIAYAITVTCPPVTAGFTTNVSTGYPPLTVAFTDTSTSARPITQWQWNFGDGTTNATNQNPTHTFVNPGTYQVTLTATNECGQVSTIAYAITVTCPPVTAGFTTNVSTGYPPLTVSFTDTSTSARPITQWQWNFGDGTTNTTTQNPAHTFINSGTYQVTLTATNNCGQYASTSQVITVSSCYRIINASASTGGTISPAGQVQVTCGASQTFTITPASGYITTDVIVNGISQGSLSTYTFTNVQQNHTIHAEFFSPTDLCAITGFVTNATTGIGIGGIRVEVYNQARTILLRSGVSQPNGYYEIIQQPQQGQRLDITSPDTATWVTTFPVSKWYDDILFNPGAKCGADNINFSGIQMVPSPGDFLYNAPKSAAILAGGMIEFQVSPPVNNNAYIIVNNVRSDFAVGDLITIRLLSAQNSGNVIYMSQNSEGHSITTFAFGNAAIYKNRSLLTTGQINDINIPKAVSLISTLVLNIPAGQNAWTTFSWGGNPVFPTGQNSQGVTIYNLRPGTDGILNINLNNVYAQGAGDRYQLF